MKLYEIHEIDGKLTLLTPDGGEVSRDAGMKLAGNLSELYPPLVSLYFLRATHHKYGELCKFGITTQSLAKRIYQLKHAYEVTDIKEDLVIWEFDNWSDAYEAEQGFHQELEQSRAFGEWYYFGERVEKYMNETLEQWERHLEDALKRVRKFKNGNVA